MSDPLDRVATAIERMADNQERFYREVLGVLTAAKDGDGSLRSEQPAAAPAREPGYYAGDWEDQCTARGHENRRAWHRCLRPTGHEGLHEDGMGNAFEKDFPAAAPSQQEGEDSAPNLRP